MKLSSLLYDNYITSSTVWYLARAGSLHPFVDTLASGNTSISEELHDKLAESCFADDSDEVSAGLKSTSGWCI